MCVEVTDDAHPGSRRAQSLVVDLAREVSQIPFFRVKIGFGRTYDEVVIVGSIVLTFHILCHTVKLCMVV